MSTIAVMMRQRAATAQRITATMPGPVSARVPLYAKYETFQRCSSTLTSRPAARHRIIPTSANASVATERIQMWGMSAITSMDSSLSVLSGLGAGPGQICQARKHLASVVDLIGCPPVVLLVGRVREHFFDVVQRGRAGVPAVKLRGSAVQAHLHEDGVRRIVLRVVELGAGLVEHLPRPLYVGDRVAVQVARG